MQRLRIRLTYEDRSKILYRAVGINLRELPIVDEEAEANIDEGRIYHSLCNFVAQEVPTSLTLHLLPPPNFRIKFTDYPDDHSGTITWDAGKKNHGYVRGRRFSMEPVQ